MYLRFLPVYSYCPYCHTYQSPILSPPFSLMISDNSPQDYFSSHFPSHAEIIEISYDSEEEKSTSPKVEPPNYPSRLQSVRTSDLISHVQTLEHQLANMRDRNQCQVSLYQRKIEELEINSSHVFKYIGEIQSYVERKIANLEASLVYAQADLHKAHQEIAKWKDL